MFKAGLAAALLASSFAAVPQAQAASAQPGFSAVIRWTTGGVPHILAKDWGSLGFGYGYAFAQDNLCTMADDYVTVEARRSLYFGATATYEQRGNGTTVNNLDSDVFFQHLIDSGVTQALARDLDPRVRQLDAGYVRGYNHYLASVGGAPGVPDLACRGKAWVQPITEADSIMRFYQLMLESSQGLAIDAIAQAMPPSASGAASGSGAAAASGAAGRALAETDPARAADVLAAGLSREMTAEGSNAVAIGSAGTRGGHGMLLGN